MKQQIKHRLKGTVLFECEVPEELRGMAMRYALDQAFKQGANLVGADISIDNLSGAQLSRAILDHQD